MAKAKEPEDLLGSDEPQEEEAGFFGEEPAAPNKSKRAAAKVMAEPENASSAADLDEAAAPAREGYVVLARKYRPQTFDEIVGQENVQRALRGAIATGQISHSYLFSGPRGTGKTSTARILAKAVNCQNGGPRPDPCGRCASCVAITAGSSLDVIEIDAASNTGVDNIRELRSGVVLAPFSRYKVYIVDEVHMLSTQAFNALLKTLEEPPSQVIFILATTELHKVPETIVSRCQSFQFRRFSTDELKGQLDRILEKEIAARGLEVTPEDRDKILDLVARNAEGGMRDAQVALDQVLVFAQGKLDFESVRKFLGLAENDALDAFLRAMYGRDIDELLMMIDQFAASGQDLELFVKSLCEHIRDLLIVRTAPGRTELVNVSEDRYQLLRNLADELPPAFLMNLASGFLRLAEEMKTAAHPRFLLELAVMRLAAVDAVDDVQNIVQRLQAVERALGGGGAAGASQQVVSPARASVPAKAVRAPEAPLTSARVADETGALAAETNPGASEVRESGATLVAVEKGQAAPLSASAGSCTAQELMTYLLQRTEGTMMNITLTDCTRVLKFDGRTMVLGVDARNTLGLQQLNRPQALSQLRELARELCGSDVLFRVETGDFKESESEPAEPQVSQPVSEKRTSPQLPNTVLDKAAAEAPKDKEIEAASIEQLQKEEPAQRVYMSPELREKTMREYKGDQLRKFLEGRPELKDLVEKVKEVFNVEDAQFSFRARSF